MVLDVSVCILMCGGLLPDLSDKCWQLLEGKLLCYITPTRMSA